MVHQQSFLKRLWTYSCQYLVKDLPDVRDRVQKTHDMYEKIPPVYAIALVASRYFDDESPIHSFVLTERGSGQVLELPFGESRQPFRRARDLLWRGDRERSQEGYRARSGTWEARYSPVFTRSWYDLRRGV